MMKKRNKSLQSIKSRIFLPDQLYIFIIDDNLCRMINDSAEEALINSVNTVSDQLMDTVRTEAEQILCLSWSGR